MFCEQSGWVQTVEKWQHLEFSSSTAWYNKMLQFLTVCIRSRRKSVIMLKFLDCSHLCGCYNLPHKQKVGVEQHVVITVWKKCMKPSIGCSNQIWLQSAKKCWRYPLGARHSGPPSNCNSWWSAQGEKDGRYRYKFTYVTIAQKMSLFSRNMPFSHIHNYQFEYRVNISNGWSKHWQCCLVHNDIPMLSVLISGDKSNRCCPTSNWQLAGCSMQAYSVSQSNTYVQESSDANIGRPIPDKKTQFHLSS